jgi:hypothetical protein
LSKLRAQEAERILNMYHFDEIVIVKSTDADYRPGAPASEEGPAHDLPDDECHCVGRDAWDFAELIVSCAYGSWEELRERYRATRRQLGVDARLGFPTWREFTRQRYTVRTGIARQHPAWGRINVECPDCQGSGTYEREGMAGLYTHPPTEVHWLAHDLSKYYTESGEPEALPCLFCRGTGRRDDRGGARCSWCSGSGQVSCPDLPEEEPSTPPAIRTQDLLTLFPDGLTTDELLTPEGREYSYQRRWRGLTDEEKAQCAEEVQVLLSRHPDHVVELSNWMFF